MPTRRGTIIGGLALAMIGPAAYAASPGGMFGMIGRITARPGQRAALAALLLEGSGTMPGCLSYIVAEDAADPDIIWVSEAWRDEASHKASLALPQVRDAITRARPLIAGFDTVATTCPVGGTGL